MNHQYKMLAIQNKVKSHTYLSSLNKKLEHEASHIYHYAMFNVVDIKVAQYYSTIHQTQLAQLGVRF